jgi:hypothetical protein
MLNSTIVRRMIMQKSKSRLQEIIKSIIPVITCSFISFSAFSGEGSGKVTRVYAHEKNDGQGVIMFDVENHSNPPSDCPGHEWAFDANTEQGKAMYSLLLTAASKGQAVRVKGKGDCRDWGDRERPSWIMLEF